MRKQRAAAASSPNKRRPAHAWPADWTLHAHVCRLFDDVYSKDDVEELCADIVAGVKERVRRDMESY
ncbi:hypothetical protein EON67_11375, partial [archaeon]